MLGVKINEFDNSDGTLESFNKLFPKTPLKGDINGDVEILGIVEKNVLIEKTPYVRIISVEGQVVEHDFGENNFQFINEDFMVDESVRFKYYAKDLDGVLLETAYNFKSLAEKLGCKIGIVKNRLVTTIDKTTNTTYKFNVTRKEL